MTAVLPAMTSEKALHPFFTKINGHHDTNGANGASSGDDTDRGNGFDGALDEASNERKSGKKRKSKEFVAGNGKTQKTLEQLVNPSTDTIEVREKYDGREIPNSCSSDPILTPPRKKRRTSPIEPIDELQEEEQPANDLDNDSVVTSRGQPSPQVVIPASSPLPATTSDLISTAPSAPRKMLRLNASGKFSSPPSKKPRDAEPESQQPTVDAPRRRGRPRKSREMEKPETQHHVVIIKYESEGDNGDRIDRILNGQERVQDEVKLTPKKQRTPRKQGPAKPTHPFFIGKPNDQPAASKQESPRKASAATPGKLRKHTLTFGQINSAAPSNDAWTSTLLRDRMIMKHPGATEPAWPTQAEAHVRGLESDEMTPPPAFSSLRRRKQKTAKRDMPAEESLLNRFASQLTIEEEGKLRDDGFREPHPSLKLPRNLLIPGQEIWEHASKELSADHQNDVGNDAPPVRSAPLSSHPAIDTLRQRIPDSLTAFDELHGESCTWTQKYSPTTSAEVLQSGKVMDILKTWLTSLTVTAVGTVFRPNSRQHLKPESRPKKKQRRKNKDMDDFLVESDEEVHDMDELTDAEDEPPSAVNRSTKSVVQTISDGVKTSNAVLIAGPHGCGKTAAVYAVAKDVGFKVFEISSSERRSGKDVLERVGDMAENHLVNHHGNESGDTSAAEEPSRNEEAFQRDLASGRQGKMDAFFMPKANISKSSPKKKQPKPKVKALEQLQQAVKKPAKGQQQSLILLEEVDVLFKEDREFWSTVLKLITTSKRPFIMTCNDEDLVPLQAMTLHAILRFSPPAIDLATDYLLTIAASEGHLIKRSAVLALYRYTQFDLRASISELNFWCQMGVGDPQGGLSWIYQRYPPGTDLNQDGQRLRVVSQDTFQTGLGHIPDSRLSEEDQTLWVVEDFAIDPLGDMGWSDLPSMPKTLPTLERYEKFAASLSATDAYTALLHDATFDTSQKPMSDKACSHYIEGMRLLQIDEIARYDTLLQKLAVSSSLAAHRVAGFPISKRDTTASKSRYANCTDYLTRRQFACFDAISIPNESGPSTNQSLSQSAFDGPLGPIAIDLAPYVRSILQYEAAISEQHHRLHSILGDGNTNHKQVRTTRAARSALQGSQRSLTRREKWFTKDLDVAAVLATGGPEWPKATATLDDFESRAETDTPSPSAESAWWGEANVGGSYS